ncbi:MAG: phenylalanine--tRNA ligase subunit beta [Fusobacteria bacterium]|nr:phenylalanine--tRNA ligase subunit beta [Fusobacteriota bacterium]
MKKSKIRGIESCGMMCSGKELGISEEHEGILILESSATVGNDITNHFELDDIILHLEITPNRGDCLSYFGIAKELAAYYELPFVLPEVKHIVSSKGNLTVSVAENNICQRYVGCVVENVKVTESPNWLKKALLTMGVRSINNIVDVTNFILFETGQPIHAFDKSKLEGNQIYVRASFPGETIITLDEKERTLPNNTIVISDDKKAVAIAGIMGGANAEIDSDTKEIVIEIASFNSDMIRQSAKALALSSDASYRFERGVDATNIEYVLKRAVELIAKVSGGHFCEISEHNTLKYEKKIIPLHLKRLSKNIGMEIDEHKVVHILTKLNFVVERVTPKSFKVHVPSYRLDVTQEPDLYEEVARYFGYNNIVTTNPIEALKQGVMGEVVKKSYEMRELLVSLGVCEAINFSFIPKNALEKISYEIDEDKKIHILNPLSDDMVLMRPTLLFSLIKNGSENLKRGVKEVRLFEVSKVFERVSEQNQESLMAGIVLCGNKAKSIWSSEIAYDFFDLKGIVEEILNSRGVNYQLVRSSSAHVHPGVSADIMIGKDCLGTFGQIHPEVLENFDIEDPIYVAEISVEKLYKYGKKKTVVEEISKYPSVERDLALLVDREVLVADMLKEAEKISSFVKKVELFDVYQGERIANNLKSVAFNMLFSSIERTLTDLEVNEIMQNLITKLNKRFNAALREG